jgi:hypothetical protein
VVCGGQLPHEHPIRVSDRREAAGQLPQVTGIQPELPQQLRGNVVDSHLRNGGISSGQVGIILRVVIPHWATHGSRLHGRYIPHWTTHCSRLSGRYRSNLLVMLYLSFKESTISDHRVPYGAYTGMRLPTHP